jgi:hypothetical protein
VVAYQDTFNCALLSRLGNLLCVLNHAMYSYRLCFVSHSTAIVRIHTITLHSTACKSLSPGHQGDIVNTLNDQPFSS